MQDTQNKAWNRKCSINVRSLFHSKKNQKKKKKGHKEPRVGDSLAAASYRRWVRCWN